MDDQISKKKMRIVALKLLEFTLLSQNLLIFSYLVSFCTVLRARCDVDIFKRTTSGQSIHRVECVE